MSTHESSLRIPHNTEDEIQISKLKIQISDLVESKRKKLNYEDDCRVNNNNKKKNNCEIDEIVKKDLGRVEASFEEKLMDNKQVRSGGENNGVCGGEKIYRQQIEKKTTTIISGNGTGSSSDVPKKKDTSLMCHQCQRNDKGDVVVCNNCARKRYCYTCIKKWYPEKSIEEIEKACPVCCGYCNCKACLRAQNLAESCVKVSLDFVSPESVPECIRLTKEFCLLPKSHRAKEDTLEVKKMAFHAASATVREASKLISQLEYDCSQNASDDDDSTYVGKRVARPLQDANRIEETNIKTETAVAQAVNLTIQQPCKQMTTTKVYRLKEENSDATAKPQVTNQVGQQLCSEDEDMKPVLVGQMAVEKDRVELYQHLISLFGEIVPSNLVRDKVHSTCKALGGFLDAVVCILDVTPETLSQERISDLEEMILCYSRVGLKVEWMQELMLSYSDWLKRRVFLDLSPLKGEAKSTQVALHMNNWPEMLKPKDWLSSSSFKDSLPRHCADFGVPNVASNFPEKLLMPDLVLQCHGTTILVFICWFGAIIASDQRVSESICDKIYDVTPRSQKKNCVFLQDSLEARNFIYTRCGSSRANDFLERKMNEYQGDVLSFEEVKNKIKKEYINAGDEYGKFSVASYLIGLDETNELQVYGIDLAGKWKNGKFKITDKSGPLSLIEVEGLIKF